MNTESTTSTATNTTITLPSGEVYTIERAIRSVRASHVVYNVFEQTVTIDIREGPFKGGYTICLPIEAIAEMFKLTDCFRGLHLTIGVGSKIAPPETAGCLFYRTLPRYILYIANDGELMHSVRDATLAEYTEFVQIKTFIINNLPLVVELGERLVFKAPVKSPDESS